MESRGPEVENGFKIGKKKMNMSGVENLMWRRILAGMVVDTTPVDSSREGKDYHSPGPTTVYKLGRDSITSPA